MDTITIHQLWDDYTQKRNLNNNMNKMKLCSSRVYNMSFKVEHFGISVLMLGEVNVIRQHCDGGYKITQKLISLEVLRYKLIYVKFINRTWKCV